MTQFIHPRILARMQQVEYAHSLAAERQMMSSIDEVEKLAVRLDGVAGTRMSDGVRTSCAALRRSLAEHGPDSSAGRIVRRFVPDRIAELRQDCESTALALGAAI